jgi:hypothetical protein
VVRLVLVVVLACGIISPASAVNIAWVSFHAADDMPSAGAAGVGFAQAPDKGYTDLLKNAGHNVTRILTSAAPDVTLLNTFDLVMISRSNPSGNFQTADSTASWASITKPTIHLGGYAIRGGTSFPDANSRLGFTTGSTIPDIAGPVKLTISAPNHPIFTGVARDANNVMLDVFADRATLPVAPFTVQSGISVNTNPLAAGGTLLAGLPDLTAGSPGMVIGEFPIGTTLSNEFADVQQGRRLVFLTGSREAGISSEATGIIDLSATGKAMFLNAVNYLTNRPAIRPGDVNGNGTVDINDYMIIRNNFNGTGKSLATGDVNFDTVVNFLDFRVWKNNRAPGVGSIAELEAALGQNVPEPGSLFLALFGMAAVVRLSARRRG